MQEEDAVSESQGRTLPRKRYAWFSSCWQILDGRFSCLHFSFTYVWSLTFTCCQSKEVWVLVFAYHFLPADANDILTAFSLTLNFSHTLHAMCQLPSPYLAFSLLTCRAVLCGSQQWVAVMSHVLLLRSCWLRGLLSSGLMTGCMQTLKAMCYEATLWTFSYWLCG